MSTSQVHWQKRLPDISLGRVVVAHLGSGASMCALAGGRSIDSSMGFTALDGLPMGTRSGSLDAGVILWLQQQKGWDVGRVEHLPLCRLRPQRIVGRVKRHANASGLAVLRWRSWQWTTLSTMSRVPRARWQPRWAVSMAWCSPPALASVVRKSSPGFCTGCAGSASRSTKQPINRAVRS